MLGELPIGRSPFTACIPIYPIGPPMTLFIFMCLSVNYVATFDG